MVFSTAVTEAKAFLARGLQEAARVHADGGSGQTVCRQIAEQRDKAISSVFLAAASDLDEEDLLDEVALVAHGGYGRGEVSPGSDVDLMLLRRSDAKPVCAFSVFSQKVMRDLCDTGLSLGYSVRTIDESVQLAIQDAVIGSSLIESRYLAGNRRLFEDYQKSLLTRISRQQASFCKNVAKNRAEERARYGETVYLLEPNLKRSSGGLRDIQMVRWIGQARFGNPEIHSLREMGELSASDAESLDGALEFLLRLRNELHFHAGHAVDVLDRSDQIRIASEFGYENSIGQLAVEHFMQDYFRHTQSVRHVVERFTDRALAERRFGRAIETVASHRVGSDYRVGPNWIRATSCGLARLEGNLVAIMQLIELSNLYNKPISPETWEVIRKAHTKSSMVKSEPPSKEVIRRFRLLLGHPARLGELLRGLHEASILGLLVPEMEHARGLIQFNQYHKYTIDEHCLRAVDWVTKLSKREPSPLALAYHRIERKELLHLALLIHDLGKGFNEDHSLVGEQIARRVALRLEMDEEETETLAFLVRHHLMMNHLALRRDTKDRAIVVPFAVEVGSTERLQMLFCMTAADLAAVGPDTWNNWKEEMLTTLFHQTLEHLTGNDEKREATVDAAFEAELVKHLPVASQKVVAKGEWFAESATIRFTIGTNEDLVPGIFHRLTGALTSAGLDILSAEIHTFDNRMILDRFVVHDPDFSGQPPAHRIEEIETRLVDSLLSWGDSMPQFRRIWSKESKSEPLDHAPKTQVLIDNHTSDRYTILDIFAPDRTGMLYKISRKLFDLGLDVFRARISTYLDQIVDVFYVTTRSGEKIFARPYLDRIHDTLIETIEGE